MTIATILRATGFAAALLLSPDLLSAQEQLTPPSQTRQFGAPAGHRQPRAADVPTTDRINVDPLEERQQAELNRRLRICRGC